MSRIWRRYPATRTLRSGISGRGGWPWAGPRSRWLCKGSGEAGFKTVQVETRRVKAAGEDGPSGRGGDRASSSDWLVLARALQVGDIPGKRVLLGLRNAVAEGLKRLGLSGGPGSRPSA